MRPSDVRAEVRRVTFRGVARAVSHFVRTIRPDLARSRYTDVKHAVFSHAFSPARGILSSRGLADERPS